METVSPQEKIRSSMRLHMISMEMRVLWPMETEMSQPILMMTRTVSQVWAERMETKQSATAFLMIWERMERPRPVSKMPTDMSTKKWQMKQDWQKAPRILETGKNRSQQPTVMTQTETRSGKPMQTAAIRHLIMTGRTAWSRQNLMKQGKQEKVSERRP